MADSSQSVSAPRVARVLLLILATASFIPLSMFFYWLAYAVHGKGDRVYYDFGGYFEYHVIMPAIGVLTGCLFLLTALWIKPPWRVRLYFGFAAALFLGYFVFSLLDC